jgi:hypothetical protein
VLWTYLVLPGPVVWRAGSAETVRAGLCRGRHPKVPKPVESFTARPALQCHGLGDRCRVGVGSMTDLGLTDASVAGLVAFWSLIHVPDHALSGVLGHFRRVPRPGGPLLLGFHVGDTSRLETEGYGGHPMKVYVHRRQPAHGQPGCAMLGSRSRPTCCWTRTGVCLERSFRAPRALAGARAS